MMVSQTPWRELACFDDLRLARIVATSIAAMEFEVRLADRADAAGIRRSAPREAPYAVEVDADDWADLAEVLDEIIDEQEDFDRALTRAQTRCAPAPAVIFITVTSALDILLLVRILES